MQEPHLSREALAFRWKVTVATLDQWRWNGKGPRFFKIGRNIFYRIKEIESFEESKIRQSTSQNFDIDFYQNDYRKQK